MVYGLFRALPGAPGFLATVTPEKLASQELDTSVGVPGPYGFAVRIRCPRQKHHQRPPHPAPRFVTLRNAPRSGRDGCEYRGDLGIRKNRIFFSKGLDTGVLKRPDGQISCAGNIARGPKSGQEETSDQSRWPQTIAPDQPMLYRHVAAGLNLEETSR